MDESEGQESLSMAAFCRHSKLETGHLSSLHHYVILRYFQVGLLPRSAGPIDGLYPDMEHQVL